ncbi:MAG: ATP-grasp domain-containing protein, partial [Hydrotalea flava]|nr:ATP-grasp domain-containing protein [Hydrotalea flava]
MFPDPKIIKYYNDKYRQFLFLKGHNYPIPETIPFFSEESVKLVEKKLGYPIILKNRYGAGGGSVFMIHNKKELYKYYKLSKLDFYNLDAIKYFL